MNCLHLVMPMAGEGKRFKNGGYQTPKPLIQLEGIPLFRRAVDSLKNLSIPVKYSFIVRQEHIDFFHIESDIRHFFPDATIFPVEQTTRGAVETCMYAASLLDKNNPVLVLDCDLEFRSIGLENFIKYEMSQPNGDRIGGGLVSFCSDSPRYSYAEVDMAGMVVRTAEKEVISDHALAGAYYFSSADIFLSAANTLLSGEIDKPEYYLSLLYNLILKQGYRVKLFPLEYYMSNGTPDELKEIYHGLSRT